MNRLKTDLNGLLLKNPVTVASGTFGFGREFSQIIDLNMLGAISVKGLTLKPRLGNAAPRITETAMGIINSVGLENPGVEYFVENELPFLKQYDTKVIANINGNSIEEYQEMARILNESKVDSIEVNISCPNVKQGGVHFGTNPDMVELVTRSVRECTNKHLIVKLSPNVTDIKQTALAAERGGANCLSMINTLTAMAIDIHTRKPKIGNVIGGLSGPAVKPVAIKMVYETAKVVKIPIIGMGGIRHSDDAVEFMIAGATAISIGTANMIHPYTAIDVLKGIKQYVERYGYESIGDVVGTVNL